MTTKRKNILITVVVIIALLIVSVKILIINKSVNQTLLILLIVFGVAAGFAVPAFLVIHLWNLLDKYIHKKWLRIEIKEYDELSFPQECPNCLSVPSNTLVRVERTFHGHMISITYSIDWPHCQTCAEFYTIRYKLWRIYSIYILVGLLVVITGLVFSAIKFNLGWSAFIYAGIVFFVIALLLYSKYRKVIRNMPLKNGYIKKGDVIELRTAGKGVLSGKYSLDVWLRHPQYAKLFLEKNATLKPKYNPDALKSVLDLLELEQASHNL